MASRLAGAAGVGGPSGSADRVGAAGAAAGSWRPPGRCCPARWWRPSAAGCGPGRPGPASHQVAAVMAGALAAGQPGGDEQLGVLLRAPVVEAHLFACAVAGLPVHQPPGRLGLPEDLFDLPDGSAVSQVGVMSPWWSATCIVPIICRASSNGTDAGPIAAPPAGGVNHHDVGCPPSATACWAARRLPTGSSLPRSGRLTSDTVVNPPIPNSSWVCILTDSVWEPAANVTVSWPSTSGST